MTVTIDFCVAETIISPVIWAAAVVHLLGRRRRCLLHDPQIL